MKEKELSELSDRELLEKRKKTKSAQTMNAVLLGMLIGIAIYSTVKHGLGFFTFFPLFFAFLIARNRKGAKTLEEEIKSRNLK